LKFLRKIDKLRRTHRTTDPEDFYLEYNPYLQLRMKKEECLYPYVSNKCRDAYEAEFGRWQAELGDAIVLF